MEVEFGIERILVLGIIILSVFVYINVSQTVGTFLGLLTIAYFVLAEKGEGIGILSSRRDLNQAILVAFVAFGVWFATASLMGQYFGNTFSVFDFRVFSALKATTNIPVLSSDPNVIFIIYGITIPVVETVGILALPMIFFLKIFKFQLRFNPRDYRMYVVAVLAAMVAALYHLTVRQSSQYALAVDTMFFALSAFLVFKYGKLLPAMLLHVYVNSSIIAFGGR